MSTREAVQRFGRGHVRHQVDSGRWQRPWRGVVVTHSGPVGLAERRRGLLLTCAPRSALGGLTALDIDGLEGFTPASVCVVVPEGARRPVREGLTTHSSALLDEADVHPTRDPRRTRVPRSLVDLAAWATTDRYARAVVLAAFQQRLVRKADVLRAIERRGSPRRSGLVRESVLDAEGGMQSLPEADFDALIARGGLPAPTRQRPVPGPNGRYYLDVEWEAYGVAAEIHGLPHHGVVQWSHDLVRATEVVIAGPRLLVFTSYVIRHEPDIVLDQVVWALRGGGWQGVVRPLPS